MARTDPDHVSAGSAVAALSSQEQAIEIVDARPGHGSRLGNVRGHAELWSSARLPHVDVHGAEALRCMRQNGATTTIMPTRARMDCAPLSSCPGGGDAASWETAGRASEARNGTDASARELRRNNPFRRRICCRRCTSTKFSSARLEIAFFRWNRSD